MAAGPPYVCINAGRRSLHAPAPASAARIVVETELDICRASVPASRGGAASAIDASVLSGARASATELLEVSAGEGARRALHPASRNNHETNGVRSRRG